MSDEQDARRIAAGPTTRPVVLAAHDPRWAEQARARARDIERALGDASIEIHHIGSTSIPGIVAKPIVDLMPVAVSLAAIDARRAALEAMGYEWWGEFGLVGRRFCLLEASDGTRLVHAHCYAAGDPAIRGHLAFRDYLRAHPDEARAYEIEKRRAAALHAESSRAYTEEKAAFVRQMLDAALRWWDARDSLAPSGSS
jgi:GrpB-like predicted nucleotidyltransferase (UPF0157 family)